MNIDLTEIIVALIGVLATVITGFLIPYLKSKTGKSDWDRLIDIVCIVVNGAEQLGLKDKAFDKLSYATEQVKIALKKYHLAFDDATIRATIEAFVLELNKNEVD